MITDLELVQAAVDIYDPTSDWDHVFLIKNVRCGVRRFGTDDLLAFQGSKTFADWLRDFDFLQASSTGTAVVPKLGDLYPGFWIGMPETYGTVMTYLRSSVYIGGHSLGAARGGIFAGLMTAGGVPPKRGCVIGEPKAGMAALVQLMADVSWRSLCNQHEVLGIIMDDPVTGVPETLPIFPYQHIRPLEYMPAQPTDDLPTDLHHADLYLQTATSYLAAA